MTGLNYRMEGPKMVQAYRVVKVALVMLLLWTLAAAVNSQRSWAHFTSTAYSTIEVGETELLYKLYMTDHDLQELLGVPDPDEQKQLTDAELVELTPQLQKVLESGLTVTGDGKVGTGELTLMGHEEKGKISMVRMDLNYVFDSPVKRFMIQYQLLLNDNTQHRNYASIQTGGHTIEQVINAQNTILQILAPGNDGSTSTDHPATLGTSQQGAWSTIYTYTVLGMEHIWGGLDHMLFVLVLLLAVRTWKELLVTITAFTLGHSITLVLSALELASVSPVIVEPLIALSIVVMAAGNFAEKYKLEQRSRYEVTALFGLIHGFGFAEILSGTLSGQVVLPLFSFNLGVELGQLVVVGVCMPILWTLRRSLKHQQVWLRYGSGLVGCLGLYWFLERVLT